MSYESLKSAVGAVITANGNNEITGPILEALINDNIIPIIGAGNFKGFAETTTVPGTPEKNEIYAVINGGNFTNFGAIEVADGLSFLVWNTTADVWDVFDLSEKLKSQSLANYEDLKNENRASKLNTIGVEIMNSSAPPISKSTSDTASTISTVTTLNLDENTAYSTIITQLGSVQGQGIFFDIPAQYRDISKNIKAVVRYTATEEVPIAAYLKNGGAFINNGGATFGTLEKTEVVKTIILERSYESAANIFNFYCTQNTNSIITIHSAKLMVNDADFIEVGNLTPIGDELLNSSTPPISGATSDTTSTYTTELSTVFAEPSDYKTTIVQGSSSSVGQSIFAPIPEAQRVVGLPLSLSVKYTSTHAVGVKGYLKNGWVFVNNGNAADGILEATTEIKEIILTRDYEDTATLFNFYLNQDLNATVVIYSAQLKIPETQAPKIFNNLITTTVEIDNGGVESFNLITNTLRQYDGLVVYGSQHYEFVVKNSTAPYNENDIRGLSSYRGSERGVVTLRAETPLGVTLKTDGNSTNTNFLTPSDYAYSGQGDQIMNDVPSYQKHTFWLHESMDVYWFIIHTIDCKYCVHQDTSGEFDSLVRDNFCIQEKINDLTEWRVFGLGTRFNQKARYYRNVAEFRNNTGNPIGAGTVPMMFFWHNDNNETAPTLLECIDNKAINCGIGLFSEIGSGQPDEVILNGNTTNLPTAGIELQNHELNTSFGYNINLTINQDVNYFKLRDRASGREGLQKTSLPLNSYLFQFKNTSGATLDQGIAVKRDYANGTFSVATNSDFDAVIWRDVLNNSEGYFIPKGKTADVLCVAGSYAVGDKVSINAQGKFFESTTDVVGVVVVGIAPTSDDFVKILLF